jgi:hypothetical protein
VFLIVFKTGEALPLTFVRFWRPRNHRGEGAEQPRDAIDSWPRHQPIRDSISSANRTRARTFHVRKQSATAFSLHAQVPQGIVRGHNYSLVLTAREQASVMKTNCGQPARNLELSTSPILSHTGTTSDLRLARKHPQHRIAVSILPSISFLVRIRTIPPYEHL